MDAQSYLKPVTASDVKKGQYIYLDNRTCKIVDLHHSKTGKHGHLKVSLTALCIFKQTKHVYVCAGHQLLHEVEVKKENFDLVAMYESDGDFSVEMLSSSNEIQKLDSDELSLIDTNELFKKYNDTDDTISLVLVTAVEQNKLVRRLVSF